MEIKGTLKTLGMADTEKSAAKTSAAEPVQQQASSTSASKSAELKTIEALIGSSVPFDAAKVAALKLSISSGDYKINPGDAADGLILSVQDFLTTDLVATQKAADK
jgi:flagellar biosynthesis anti-sigma factor FlgM